MPDLCIFSPLKILCSELGTRPKLIEEQGQKVPDVAGQYNIGKSTLEKWLQRYRAEQSGKPLITGRAITPEQQEIQRLKKEVAQLKLERDILNKEG